MVSKIQDHFLAGQLKKVNQKHQRKGVPVQRSRLLLIFTYDQKTELKIDFKKIKYQQRQNKLETQTPFIYVKRERETGADKGTRFKDMKTKEMFLDL